jgi:hypothetical protein
MLHGHGHGHCLSKDQQLFHGSVTILLMYEKDSKNTVMLSYPDILASLYNPTLNGNPLPMPKNATMLEILANSLANNNVFVKDVTAQSNQMIQIFITTEESLIVSNGTIVHTTITKACETLAVMYLQRGASIAQNKSPTHKMHRTHSIASNCVSLHTALFDTPHCL